MELPITLALDTATPYLALGLLTPHGEFSWRQEVDRAHAEALPGAVQALLGEAGVDPRQLGQLVVGTGPGSYTGVRVGASYALGLGRAIGAAVVGLPSLESLIDAGTEGEQAVSLDARKGQVYGAVYRVLGGVVVEEVLPAAKYPRETFAAEVGGRLWRQDPAPDALVLARSGAARGRSDWQLQYL
ncbi:tRNA (adenosine(37)-N6)-threonylcarbamoyltransferase complex dimerization subunit type 1 TsaB [Deinococcus irradiatisoli]|uniref:tRNA (Adenosine(37)-N6)-threonylcarbamoyltransferase complex dimerization subunit type 1 TsaB n=1 Tax=Deinococcus irradiatisoli TaxID=2202254 RepID=A0A2Z3JFC1_9DEIO|nr:tRNA (adenosine(37)-N6)-threonylcarbamoyltransferase complex dimerization subunit type 1 TsaB [Deinococcus irradiatisoli]AWN23665.1 tRNA (adenosine(37)-N6)-threonylcarbamoyltransferase complex dimerization subunit type 1 TsaB [Deinococcus irradiatisoli]